MGLGIASRGPRAKRPERRALAAALGPDVALEARALLSRIGPIVQPAHGAHPSRPKSGPRHSGAKARAGVRVVAWNMVYPTAAGPTERLNIYAPTGAVPSSGRPVLIAIHGGGWRKYDKNSYGARVAGAFVPRGYVVIAPNYPLSAPHRPTWPLNLDDLRSVVAWTRTHAAALGVNPGQIAAIGESAGANLAALLGSGTGPSQPGDVSTQVDAVVGFSTPTNLAALDRSSPYAALAAAQFLGGPPRRVPANYAAASPIDHVSPTDSPMLLVHGKNDPLIPPAQSRTMIAALQHAGVRGQLVLVAGGHDLDFPAHYENLVPKVLEFLGTTWKDKGTPLT